MSPETIGKIVTIGFGKGEASVGFKGSSCLVSSSQSKTGYKKVIIISGQHRDLHPKNQTFEFDA